MARHYILNTYGLFEMNYLIESLSNFFKKTASFFLMCIYLFSFWTTVTRKKMFHRLIHLPQMNSRQMTTTIWGHPVTFSSPGHPWFFMKYPLWLSLLIPLRGTPLLLNHILSNLYLLHYNVTLKFSFLIYYFDKAHGNEFLRESKETKPW